MVPPVRRPAVALFLCLLALGLAGCGDGTSAKLAPGAGSSGPGALTTASSASRDAQPVRAVATRRPGSSPVIVSSTTGNPSRLPGAEAGDQASSLTSPALRLPGPAQSMMVVDATDGGGLWMRRAPAGEPVRLWPDGTPMLVVGEAEQADGRIWRHVWTLDGQSGWAAAEYLFPADPSAVAAAQAALAQRQPDVIQPGAVPPSGLQARVVSATAQPTAVATPSTVAARARASSRTGLVNAGVAEQAARAPATPGPSSAAGTAGSGAAAAAATATPAPTTTAVPTATPRRAPAGATSIQAGTSSLVVAGVDRDASLRVGNRPRGGMELVAVHITVENGGDAPLALYRGTFRLAFGDKSRAEPLAGRDPAVPYSASVPAGESFDAWLTFEVPAGAKVDALIWSPEREASYAIGL